MPTVTATSSGPPGLPMADLRRRIGLLAGWMQAGALAWIALIVIQTVLFWGRPEIVARKFAQIPGLAVLDPPGAAYAAALMVIAVVVGFAGWVALEVWRLAAIYRNGGVFTVASAAAQLSTAFIGGLLRAPRRSHWQTSDPSDTHLSIGPTGPHVTGPWDRRQGRARCRKGPPSSWSSPLCGRLRGNGAG
jgi:hypothetical protein